ncbi:FliG C-terminal domain-containing protein [Marinospirillum perlucidum]|uniref:FliG C-terminal domain-containing protein n=1 Tax=Marinospirillum perlucidum TaxID=1982602 RepID=UPI000DF4307D|nr:FliG C-terminal domain-containing protein [Marinospirillum perlucidum]
MLDIVIKEQQVHLKDRFISWKLSLHAALMLLADLNEQLPGDDSNYALLRTYYQRQLSSLLLLPPRERQQLLQDLNLEALACLLKILEGSASHDQLKRNLSHRRLQQLEEEPVYQKVGAPSIEDLQKGLEDFFEQLQERINHGEIQLPDPSEPYY